MLTFLDRIGRPLTRLAAMALVVALTVFVLRFGDALSAGLHRWARGEAIDLNGLAAVLGASAGLVGIVMPFIVSLFRDRRLERVEEIRAGTAPNGPFGQPSSPPEGGPRPGDSP